MREVCFLLCSEDIPNSHIPLQLQYPRFSFEKEGKLAIDQTFLENKDLLKELEALSDKTALGRYAERLLSIWFKHSPHFDLLKFNHQIVIDKLTVGEIDFLLKEVDSKRAIQLEFALKYFLAFGAHDQRQFIGPKGKDSLESKSRKLIDQQMQLSLNHSEMLEESLRSLDFRPQIMLKGELFYPLDQKQSQNHWLHYKDLKKLSIWDKNSEFLILTYRRDWIFPFDKDLWQNNIGSSECIDQLAKKNADLPIMIAYKDGKVYGRIMLVSDNWPAKQA